MGGKGANSIPNSKLPTPIPKALTIAGSDSGAGAGIQADLKTFAALGAYGTSVVTALTAQNTLGVSAIQEIDAEFVGQQIDAVMTDIGAAAAKTGMLCSAAVVQVVAARVRHYGIDKLVVDPVMVSTSGKALLDPEAVAVLRERLLPVALVVTPNLAEAGALAGMTVESETDMREAAQRIRAMGPMAVIVKGGHLAGDADDVLFDGRDFHVLHAARIEAAHTHGTGCTFSAAIAAYLARGFSLPKAATAAKEFITAAIRSGFAVGSGVSPVNPLGGLPAYQTD